MSKWNRGKGAPRREITRELTAVCTVAECRWYAAAHGDDCTNDVIGHMTVQAARHSHTTGHDTVVTYQREVRYCRVATPDPAPAQ